jgi:phosphate acetyltransferase
MKPSLRHETYRQLIAMSKGRPPLRVAVAHPCDEIALESAAAAYAIGLIDPVLVGPSAKITSIAAKFNIDISRFKLIATPHSHAAAEKTVELVRAGEVETIMKGSVHTDELMAAVFSHERGLRTARRISHCFVMDVPGRPQNLIITDAAINITPSLDDKVDIVQNAIDLAHALNFGEVRVAILSAMETVSAKLPSTVEAAALCKMAERGQITGAIIDGPLALDNAVDIGAARLKHIDSPVAGRANVIVVPDLEAGNILAKSLSFMANADAAGIVLGARVPIILTSRADSTMAHLASCAVAALLVRRRLETPALAAVS